MKKRSAATDTSTTMAKQAFAEADRLNLIMSADSAEGIKANLDLLSRHFDIVHAAQTRSGKNQA